MGAGDRGPIADCRKNGMISANPARPACHRRNLVYASHHGFNRYRPNKLTLVNRQVLTLDTSEILGNTGASSGGHHDRSLSLSLSFANIFAVCLP